MNALRSIVVMPALLIVAVLLLAGCSGPVYPITTGSHVPADYFSYGKPDASGRLVPHQPQRFIVWANHPGVENYITGLLLKLGYTVVERARLQNIFSEQNLRISLADTSVKLTEEILKAGKLVGASQVIFAEAHPQTGEAWSSYARPARVEIRSVSVETGEVRWAGTAQYLQIVNDADIALVALAHSAIERATCRVEDGNRWEEPTASSPPKCIMRDWQAESRSLQEEKQRLDQQKENLDRQKERLDLLRGVSLAKQQQLDEYNRQVTEYTRQIAEYSQRVQKFNQQTAIFRQQQNKGE